MLSIKQTLVQFQNYHVIKLVTFGFKSRAQNRNLIRLGSEYGGWWVIKEVLDDKSKKRVLISAGLGFDVTFDEALLSAGFEVIGLDPLEDSVEFATRMLDDYPKFSGLNRGLWKDTGTEKFFSPKDKSHDSWSATNLQRAAAKNYKEFKVISIKDLFQKFPQLESSDYCALKMDIEGSEVEVIPTIVDFRKKFDLLAIEMDFLSLIPFLSLLTRIQKVIEARKLLRALKGRGYKLAINDNFNFIWI